MNKKNNVFKNNGLESIRFQYQKGGEFDEDDEELGDETATANEREVQL